MGKKIEFTFLKGFSSPLNIVPFPPNITLVKGQCFQILRSSTLIGETLVISFLWASLHLCIDPFVNYSKRRAARRTRVWIFSTYFLEMSFELEIQSYQVCGRIADRLVEVKDHHTLGGPHCRTALPIIIKLILMKLRCSWISDHWQKFLEVLGNVVLSTQNQTVGLGESFIQTHQNSQRLMLFLSSFPFLYVHYYPSFIVPVSLFGPFPPFTASSNQTPSDGLCNRAGSQPDSALLDLWLLLSSKWFTSVITLQPEWETCWRGRETGWQTRAWQGGEGTLL